MQCGVSLPKGRPMSEAYKSVLETVKVLLAVVGALYVAWQYNEAISREKSARAQLFVTRYNEGDIAASRIELEDQHFSQYIRNAKEFSENQGVKLSLDHGNSNETGVILSNNKLRKSFLRLHFFFNDVSVCGYTDVCNAEILCSIMSRDIEAVRQTFRPIYRAWSADYNEDLLSNINKFLDANCCINLLEYYCKDANNQNTINQCTRYWKQCGLRDLSKDRFYDVIY